MNGDVDAVHIRPILQDLGQRTDVSRQLAVEAENKGTVEEFSRGVEMVLKRFLDIFDSHQVRGESAVGQEFDPRKHEALTMVESADHKPGTVIQELKKPYFFKSTIRLGCSFISCCQSAFLGSDRFIEYLLYRRLDIVLCKSNSICIDKNLVAVK